MIGAQIANVLKIVCIIYMYYLTFYIPTYIMVNKAGYDMNNQFFTILYELSLAPVYATVFIHELFIRLCRVFVDTIIPLITRFWNDVVMRLVKKFCNGLILRLLKNLYNSIVIPIWENVIIPLIKYIEKFALWIYNMCNYFIENVVHYLTQLIEFVKPYIVQLWNFLKKISDFFTDILKQIYKTVVNFIIYVRDVIVDIVLWLWRMVKPLVDMIINAICDCVTWTITKICDIVTNIYNWGLSIFLHVHIRIVYWFDMFVHIIGKIFRIFLNYVIWFYDMISYPFYRLWLVVKSIFDLIYQTVMPYILSVYHYITYYYQVCIGKIQLVFDCVEQFYQNCTDKIVVIFAKVQDVWDFWLRRV